MPRELPLLREVPCLRVDAHRAESIVVGQLSEAAGRISRDVGAGEMICLDAVGQGIFIRSPDRGYGRIAEENMLVRRRAIGAVRLAREVGGDRWRDRRNPLPVRIIRIARCAGSGIDSDEAVIVVPILAF